MDHQSIFSGILSDYGPYLVLLTLTVVLWNYLSWKSPKNLPPGPFSVPVLGTLPFLGFDVREPLRKLSARYGDVYTVYFGSRRVIILNSYDAIKEAFVKLSHAMSGRPQDFFWVEHIAEGKGIVSAEGPGWREQRKFTHTVLREMGVGTTLMEDKIREESIQFRHTLVALSKLGACDPAYTIQCAVANIIYSVIFGHRREYDDPEFLEYIDIMNANFEILGSAGALAVFPKLKYLPGDFFGYHRLMRTSTWMKAQFKKEIQAKMANSLTADDHGDAQDYIAAYIRVIKEHKDKGVESTFDEEQLVGVIGDLFGAGTETTTSTLRWSLVYLLRDPEIQRHVQAEIDDVIGYERMPKMADRSKMPYTEACLHELQRIADIVPLGVPHSTTEDVELFGYTIPKSTTVMSHLYAVHHDPKLWPEPERFDPNRFLDKDGKPNRPETLIPFSMGKRVCLGESLARMELFLFFTSMLQYFTFSLPPGHPPPSVKGILSITNMPKLFKVIITKR